MGFWRTLKINCPTSIQSELFDLGKTDNALKYLFVQLMDFNGSQQMNFHSFVQLFGLMSKATLQERLKLLYILHQSQLLNQSNTDASNLEDSSCDSSKFCIQ